MLGSEVSFEAATNFSTVPQANFKQVFSLLLKTMAHCESIED